MAKTETRTSTKTGAKTGTKPPKVKTSTPRRGRLSFKFNDDDWKQIEDLCGIHCTGEEIAAIMKVDYETLASRVRERYGVEYREFFKQFSAGGRASLRRQQFKAAEGGSIPMMIWLGKQYLDQSEKVHQTNADDPTNPVRPQFVSPADAARFYHDLIKKK